jgi:hypothetical protein
MVQSLGGNKSLRIIFNTPELVEEQRSRYPPFVIKFLLSFAYFCFWLSKNTCLSKNKAALSQLCFVLA